MALKFFHFSHCDDGHGQGSWEAIASVRPEHLPAARAELSHILALIESQAPGARGALEEGGVWDADCIEQLEADGWITLTFILVGPQAWGEPLVSGFDEEPTCG